MKEIITITGEIGSGKSTVGQMLAASLGFEHISTGRIQRQFAVKRGFTPLELNEASMRDREFDDAIDSYLRRLNDEGSRLVLDSRLAWHFINEAFDVFVYVDPCVGARRVLASARKEEVHSDLADAINNDLRRKHLEDERFAALYGVRCSDPDNYNLVIDATWAGPQIIADMIRESFEQAGPSCTAGKGDSPIVADTKIGTVPGGRALLSPKSLYPTKDICHAGCGETGAAAASIGSRGSSSEELIEVVRFSQYYFIVDGHRRVSCALKAGLDFVPCVIRRGNDRAATRGPKYGEAVATSYDRSRICEWQEAHGFLFASYPDPAGNPQF
jgi:CMP/dCMP kinase